VPRPVVPVADREDSPSQVQGWTQSPRSTSSAGEPKSKPVAPPKASASRPQPRPKQPLNPRQNPDTQRTVVMSVKNRQRKPQPHKNHASSDLVSFNGDHRSTLDPPALARSRIFEEALDGGQGQAEVHTLADNRSGPIKIPHVQQSESPTEEARIHPNYSQKGVIEPLDLPKIKTQREDSKDAGLGAKNPFGVTQRTLAIKNHKLNYDCLTMQNSGCSTSLGSLEPRAAVPFLASKIQKTSLKLNGRSLVVNQPRYKSTKNIMPSKVLNKDIDCYITNLQLDAQHDC
jgi:hypothetical protein